MLLLAKAIGRRGDRSPSLPLPPPPLGIDCTQVLPLSQNLCSLCPQRRCASSISFFAAAAASVGHRRRRRPPPSVSSPKVSDGLCAAARRLAAYGGWPPSCPRTRFQYELFLINQDFAAGHYYLAGRWPPLFPPPYGIAHYCARFSCFGSRVQLYISVFMPACLLLPERFCHFSPKAGVCPRRRKKTAKLPFFSTFFGLYKLPSAR